MVTVEQIKNALEITLQDEVNNEDNVLEYEVKQVKVRFGQLMDLLMKEADISDEEEDDEDENEDEESDDVEDEVED